MQRIRRDLSASRRYVRSEAGTTQVFRGDEFAQVLSTNIEFFPPHIPHLRFECVAKNPSFSAIEIDASARHRIEKSSLARTSEDPVDAFRMLRQLQITRLACYSAVASFPTGLGILPWAIRQLAISAIIRETATMEAPR